MLSAKFLAIQFFLFSLFLSCPSQENYRQTSNHPSDWSFWKLGFPCNKFPLPGISDPFFCIGWWPFSIKRGREHVIFLASCAIGWKSSAESWWRRTARLLTRSAYGYCFDWWLTFIQLLWTVRCVIFLLDKVKALYTPTLSKWVFKIVRFWMRSQFSVDKLQESASFFVRTCWNQLILGVYSYTWLVTVGITFSSVSRLTLCVSTHFPCKFVNQTRDRQLLQCL